MDSEGDVVRDVLVGRSMLSWSCREDIRPAELVVSGTCRSPCDDSVEERLRPTSFPFIDGWVDETVDCC